MNVGIVPQQAFLAGMVEVSAMVDAGDLGRRASEYFRLPGIEMRVEVDYGDWTVDFVDGAENGEDNSVVATKGDDARVSFALEGGAGLVGVGSGRPGEESVVAVLDLLDCVFVVVANAGLENHSSYEEDD